MQEGEQDWIGKFIQHLKFERQLSVHTQKNYTRDLDALLDYCVSLENEPGRSGPLTWGDLSSHDIRNFAARCHRRGLSPRSLQRRLSAVRSFYRYLTREKQVKNNPVDGVSAPRAGKRLPSTLDADQMARLLDIPDAGPLAIRDKAMLELFYSSGLRLAELVSLNLGDIDIADATVRVTGKGNKTRIVPVGRHAKAALQQWRRQRANLANAGEEAMFVSRGGQRLSPRAVQARVSYWAKRQGIDVRVYPHLFRHSFASHLLESSHDLRGVQELLGHSDISTTQIYTHLDFQHLAQIYDETHPRARIRNKGKAPQ